MNTTFNKANISALVAALVLMAGIIDNRLGWNLGPEFWNAAGIAVAWLAVYFVPNKEATA